MKALIEKLLDTTPEDLKADPQQIIAEMREAASALTTLTQQNELLREANSAFSIHLDAANARAKQMGDKAVPVANGGASTTASGTHTPGPWLIATSNSWRRIVSRDHGNVCEPIKQNDGHPDLHFKNGGPDGPDARLLAAAPELRKALSNLAAEAYASADMARECIGNTNANCLLRRADEARALLEEVDRTAPETSTRSADE